LVHKNVRHRWTQMHIHLSSSPWHQYTWPQPQSSLNSVKCQHSLTYFYWNTNIFLMYSLYALPLTTFIASWPEVWSWCHDSWLRRRRGILEFSIWLCKKYFWHPSLVIYSFATPPIRLWFRSQIIFITLFSSICTTLLRFLPASAGEKLLLF
jgi:hypothetical protein